MFSKFLEGIPPDLTDSGHFYMPVCAPLSKIFLIRYTGLYHLSTKKTNKV